MICNINETLRSVDIILTLKRVPKITVKRTKKLTEIVLVKGDFKYDFEITITIFITEYCPSFYFPTLNSVHCIILKWSMQINTTRKKCLLLLSYL